MSSRTGTVHQQLRRSSSVDSLQRDSSGEEDDKTYDPKVFDFLRVPPEDYARQITFSDIRIFQRILPDEFTSIAWNTREKMIHAPNIVEMTRRFNQVNFWVQQVILTAPLLKTRVEAMGHFIRIAKKLFELSNLHGAAAVVSALRSTAVYRLRHTWEQLPGKQKASYEKLSEFFSDDNNRANLRDYLITIKLPCIPFLAMYLADLYYIDVAHPHSGGLESHQRKMKMNNVLKVIAEFQRSDYTSLKAVDHLKEYFNDFRYIEELQKFLEDDFYKLSLKLEPDPPASLLKSASLPRGHPAQQSVINRSPSAESANKLLLSTPGGSKFQPTHRKVKSLSQNALLEMKGAETQPKRHLLDDSILEISSSQEQLDDGPNKSHMMKGDAISDEYFGPLKETERSSKDRFQQIYLTDQPTLSGCIRKKTLLKHGRRPTVASWKRFWVELFGDNLLYYPAKAFSGSERADFRAEPSKMVCIADWFVVEKFTLEQPDALVLTDSTSGNAYKWRLGSQQVALLWATHLATAVKSHKQKVPSNLMTFD